MCCAVVKCEKKSKEIYAKTSNKLKGSTKEIKSKSSLVFVVVKKIEQTHNRMGLGYDDPQLC